MPYFWDAALVILAILVVPLAFNTADATWDYVAGLCILTTIGLPILAFSLSRRPEKLVKKLAVDGIWISDDIITWGKNALELEREYTLSELYSPRTEPIRLVSEMTLPAEGDKRVNTQEATVTFQITHSRNNKKYYRIVFIHVSKDGKDIYSHKLIVGFTAPILIVNGKLFPLHQMKLVDQLRNIADTLKSFRNGGASLSNLLITPRTQISIGIPLAVGAIGGVIAQAVTDSVVEAKMKTALQAGEFIDQETGKFLLDLIENSNWRISYRTLTENEASALGAF